MSVASSSSPVSGIDATNDPTDADRTDLAEDGGSEVATPAPPEAIVESREDLIDIAGEAPINGHVDAAAVESHPVLSPILDQVSWPPRHVAVMRSCDHNLFVLCSDLR